MRGDAMSATRTMKPNAECSAELEATFHQLAEQWNAETAHLSSATQMAMHPAYQRIIGMGPAVLPFIFRELEKKPDHWYWALRAITGEDPVPPEYAGKIAKMAEVWLSYAREHGYL